MKYPKELQNQLKPPKKPKPSTATGRLYAMLKQGVQYHVDFFIKKYYEKHGIVFERNVIMSRLNSMVKRGYLVRTAPCTYSLPDKEAE